MTRTMTATPTTSARDPEPARSIPINSARLQPDLSGALVWPERRVLIVADLHLEKGSHYHGRSRHFLPPYDSAATLDDLEGVVARHQPETVICLGDSFHDRRAAERLSQESCRRIARLTKAHTWIWIAGNHDPAPTDSLGGEVHDEVVLGGLVFRHTAAPEGRPAGEISGHYHPKAAVRVRGRRVTARCFAGDGRRLILPAFGAYTGGLNVLAPAVRNLLGRTFAAHLLGRRDIFPYRQGALEPEARDGLA
jgi:hypothetical protein